MLRKFSHLILIIFILSSCGGDDSLPVPGFRPPRLPHAPDTSSTLTDSDGDGIPDNEDPCPRVKNVRGSGLDRNHDGIPDECTDSDNDGIADGIDNCPEVANPDQRDSNQNGIGDACLDRDSDLDGVKDDIDPCPYDCFINEVSPSSRQCFSLTGYPASGEVLLAVPDRDNNKVRDDGYFQVNFCPNFGAALENETEE